MAVPPPQSSDAPPPIPPHPRSIAGKVTARLPSTFSLPPSSLFETSIPRQLQEYPAEWLSRYRAFVRANASQVSSVESALRSVTYILPGRFNETPLTSEAVYTSLTLLTAFHTNLLRPDPTAPSSKRPSPQARYEQWCRATGGSIYARAGALLRTVQYTQLLCEMFAKRSGEKIRWRVVVVLELVKAICRMIMSAMTGWRPVIASSIGTENHERITDEESAASLENGDIAPAQLQRSATSGGEGGEEVIVNGHITTSSEDSGYASDATEYKMPRTGLLLPTQLPVASSSASVLSSATSVSDYLSSRAITSDELRPASQLVHPLSTTKAQIAELFYILRPVIYALALQHTAAAAFSPSSSSPSSSSSTALPSGASSKRHWKHAWTPWLVGIGLELLSRQLAKQDLTSSSSGGNHSRINGIKGLSIVEREEAARRRWGMGWWVLRGGFYENVSRGVVDGVVAKLKGKPLLDMVGSVVEDYGWLWDECYFSTATL